MKMAHKIFLALLCCTILLVSCSDSASKKIAPALNFDTFKIVSCVPVNQQTGVDPDASVIVIFNNNVNVADIEMNFMLLSNNAMVEGQIIWTSQKSFIYKPRYQLQISQRYQIEIPRTTRDHLGNTLEKTFLSEFYVGSDFTKPRVISSMPPNVPGGVTIDPDDPADPNLAALTAIDIQFSEPMDRLSTQAAFSISPEVPGYFDDATGLDTLRFVFTGTLEYGSQYRITIGESAHDVTGNTLAGEFSLIFTVGNDFTPPVVLDIGDGVNIWAPDIINTGVEKDVTTITINFSESMDRNSCENAFSIAPSVNGYFTWANNDTRMIFNTTDPFTSDTIYTITMETTATDAHDLKLENPYQVVIRTNGPNSQRISIDDVNGRTVITDPWTDLIPPQTAWPTTINLGAGDQYIFRVHFTQNGNIAVMDKTTIFGNCLIEDWITSIPDPAITDIVWDPVNDDTVDITINSLFINTLYRLTIVGGDYGVSDINGNTMIENYTIDFRQ